MPGTSSIAGHNQPGIEIIGRGNWAHWQFPAAATYTAVPLDDKTVLSSFNAPGNLLSVSLPAPDAVRAGWSMGFASDNGKGVTVTPEAGSILAGGKVLSSLTLGPGNYEYAELVSDGSEYRLTSATRNTRTTNGVESRDWPGNWLFPTSDGYAAAVADNGSVLSSFNTDHGLNVILPSTSELPSGWSIGFVTDNGKGLTVSVSGSNGGQILYPKNQSAGVASLTLADNRFEFLMLQYDGTGNFRVLQASPATAQAIGMAGTGAIDRWLFPTVDVYNAKLDDNGAVVSSFNSPASYMTVTLPSVVAISAGWTIAVASDNDKSTSVQVDGGGGEKILVPGTLGAQDSLTLSTNTSGYELVTLQFDGSNFRVVGATPLTSNVTGMSMPIGTPVSGSAACQTGTLQSDGLFLYFCSAPNTWKRVGLSGF